MQAIMWAIMLVIMQAIMQSIMLVILQAIMWDIMQAIIQTSKNWAVHILACKIFHNCFFPFIHTCHFQKYSTIHCRIFTNIWPTNSPGEYPPTFQHFPCNQTDYVEALQINYKVISSVHYVTFGPPTGETCVQLQHGHSVVTSDIKLKVK